MDHYLQADRYRALIKALADLKPYSVTGRIEEHQVIEALGEIGGVWSSSIFADLRHREALAAITGSAGAMCAEQTT